MRSVWCVGLVMAAVGLTGCGDDDSDGGGGVSPSQLTSTQDVADRIPGCADSRESGDVELTAPDLVDDALACQYKDSRVVIELYTTDDGFEQVLDRVAIDEVQGMAFVHGGRWSVRVPPLLAADLKDDMGVAAEVFTPQRSS